jgi:hypothetical protein
MKKMRLSYRIEFAKDFIEIPKTIDVFTELIPLRDSIESALHVLIPNVTVFQSGRSIEVKDKFTVYLDLK